MRELTTEEVAYLKAHQKELHESLSLYPEADSFGGMLALAVITMGIGIILLVISNGLGIGIILLSLFVPYLLYGSYVKMTTFKFLNSRLFVTVGKVEKVSYGSISYYDLDRSERKNVYAVEMPASGQEISKYKRGAKVLLISSEYGKCALFEPWSGFQMPAYELDKYHISAQKALRVPHPNGFWAMQESHEMTDEERKSYGFPANKYGSYKYVLFLFSEKNRNFYYSEFDGENFIVKKEMSPPPYRAIRGDLMLKIDTYFVDDQSVLPTDGGCEFRQIKWPVEVI